MSENEATVLTDGKLEAAYDAGYDSIKTLVVEREREAAGWRCVAVAQDAHTRSELAARAADGTLSDDELGRIALETRKSYVLTTLDFADLDNDRKSGLRQLGLALAIAVRLREVAPLVARVEALTARAEAAGGVVA